MADAKFEICGDNSGDSDENEADSDETTAEDVQFMQEAQQVAKNSGDTSTKVSITNKYHVPKDNLVMPHQWFFTLL